MELFGKVVDVFNRCIYNGCVTFEGKRIISVLKADSVPNVYILPGLIDSHIHIESSMCTPAAFAAAVVPRGTTSVVSDPHEIANVLGVEGVNYMVRDAARVPVKMCFGAPSCVPATIFETTGAAVDVSDIELLFESGTVKYLSEMMNYLGVVMNDENVLSKIRLSQKFNLPVDGHAPCLRGADLIKYVEAGISTDHECSSIDEAKEKIDLGMKILIREGSAARNLDSLKELFKIYPEKLMLCSDDLHPEALVKGHINLLVAKLIGEGYDVYDVIKSCTYNPALHYNLDSGALLPGKAADIIVVDDLEKMNVLKTIIDGKTVFEDNKVLFENEPSPNINNFNCSFVSPEQIRIISEKDKMQVVEAFDGSLVTKCLYVDVKQNTEVKIDLKEDILKIVVKDRYINKPPAIGLIKGFGLKRGAFASSVAHDSHNIVAIGTNDNDICSAINQIVSMKGGLSVSSDGALESLPLPVAGIMSNLSVEETAESYEKLSWLVKSYGCTMKAPFMTLSFMALLVIPELKMSDKGLFDVINFRLI